MKKGLFLVLFSFIQIFPQEGWFQQNFNNGLSSVYFTDSNTGWAVGEDGVIIKTSDGGISWVRQTSGTTEILQSIYFIESKTGWAVGLQGTIIKTTDGGETWISKNDTIIENLYSVFFIDLNTVWIVGGTLNSRELS